VDVAAAEAGLAAGVDPSRAQLRFSHGRQEVALDLVRPAGDLDELCDVEQVGGLYEQASLLVTARAGAVKAPAGRSACRTSRRERGRAVESGAYRPPWCTG
jgi:hypothetical protein